jgi:hypothetical protein
VRVVLASVLLLATASCALAPPPPVETAAPSAPVALAGPAAAPGPGVFWPGPLAWLFSPLAPRVPPSARLTLSNFSFDDARIEAVITPYPDCVPREGTATTDFVLPLNATRVIEAAAGSDVCWRRAIQPGPAKTAAAPAGSGWTGWSRVFLSSGRSIDAQL